MKLQLTAFRPNLNDARVRKRLTNVLDWCSYQLSTTSPEPVHHNKLREIFGTASNPLSAYLRSNLLKPVGGYIVGEQSQCYLLNESGFEKLRVLSQHMVTTSCAPRDKVYPELKTLTFTYKDQSQRYWHPLQNIKREHKASFWRGYLPFNYDIEACAPTILFQCALKAGIPPILLANLKEYLDDRSAYRDHVAALCNLSKADAKRLINSLFNGARLAANFKYCAAFRLMNGDEVAMKRLREDRKTRRLRANISTVWGRLELVERQNQTPTFEQVLSGTAKPYQKKLKTSSQKWSYYFAKERQILDVIIEALRRAAIKHFTEHDGFRTDREIDADLIEAEVKLKTKFVIKLNRE